MGKSKKKNLSDKVRSKKHDPSGRVNPFEVRINKQKHKVIGKKLGKGDKGMPGISRSRAIQKRKDTLLVEFQQRGKANKLLDRRFGENDPEMSVEDKMLQRFALESKKFHEKSGLFNLNDDDDDDGQLTHMGQSLAEIEKFDDPKVSDEDDSEDDDRGKIGAKMVAEEHFGGGMLKKSDDGSDRNKSWKERMEEIIAKSKKEKFERQHEKEQNTELTEQLDAQWRELMGKVSMGGKKRGDIGDEEKKNDADDYDVTVRELQFEIKGKPADRLKTDEEIAKDDKEKLDELETERLRRMKGVTAEEEAAAKRTHRSADDLDDDFYLEPVESFEAAYEDGQLLPQDKEKENSDEEKEEDSEEGSDEEEDDDEEEEDDDWSDEEGDEMEEGMAEGSDLDTSDDDDEETDTKEGEAKEGVTDFKDVLKKKKAVMEAARKELPYTYTAPSSYDDLLNELEGHAPEEQLTIIERIRKCHHPSLAEGNKQKLETFFSLILELLMDVAVTCPPNLTFASGLVRHLYQLCQMSPVPCGQAVVDLLSDKHEEFIQACEQRAGKGTFPTLDVVLLLKLVSVLFPTSDLRHPVVTPAMLLMSHILTDCPIRSVQDVTTGLLICNLLLEYVSFSKRYVPEVVPFLQGVAFLALPKKKNKIEPVLPPFKPIGKFNDLLKLEEGCENLDLKPISLSKAFNAEDVSYQQTSQYKATLLWQCVSLLADFSKLYSSLPAYTEIFTPAQHFWKQIPTKKYPKQVKELLTELDNSLSEKQNQPRKWVTLAKQKPQSIKMYEPKIEEDFDPTRKKRTGNKETIENQKMQHKYKKEMKGALREIRKDTQFLAAEKLKGQIEKDSERKRKVREIYGQLASQEGDYQAMKRKKDSA